MIEHTETYINKTSFEDSESNSPKRIGRNGWLLIRNINSVNFLITLSNWYFMYIIKEKKRKRGKIFV